MMLKKLEVICAATLTSLLAIACGGDDADPGATGDVIGGGEATDVEAPPTEEMPMDICARTAPPNAAITTFLEGNYVIGAQISNDTWGDSTMTLTGGVFSYTAETNVTIDRMQAANGLQLLASIGDDPETADAVEETGGYAGYGLWFGPCTDASAYRGISFTTQGTLGTEETATAEIQVQIQQSKNYPIETDKGECAFTSEATKWEDCTNNAIAIEGTLADMATVHELTWDQFTGGKPVTTVEANELLGIQFQLNCDGYCPVDVVISDLHFLE